MATGGFELDVPDTAANAAAFGYAGREDRSAFPKVRVVTIGECGSHAKVDARIGPAGGKGSGEIRCALPAFGTAGWLVSLVNPVIGSEHSDLTCYSPEENLGLLPCVTKCRSLRMRRVAFVARSSRATATEHTNEISRST